MSFEETVSVQELYAMVERSNQDSNEKTLYSLIRASRDIHRQLLGLKESHSYITNNIKAIENGKDIIDLCKTTVSYMEEISEFIIRRLEAFKKDIQEHEKIENFSYVFGKNLYKMPLDGPAKEIVENYNSSQSDGGTDYSFSNFKSY